MSTVVQGPPPNLSAGYFFLAEEQRDRDSKAGQVSQPVGACESGLGDLSKPTPPAYIDSFRTVPMVK